jgi:aldehyde oxidoreductase
MIVFSVNGTAKSFSGDPNISLLQYLRSDLNITSPKDGCSGEGSCGACTVDVNGQPRLACRTKMESLVGAEVVTTEGLPEGLARLIGRMFAEKGAVQCGFCSPGFIMRVKHLFDMDRRADRKEIVKLIKPNVCRCTGYVKIVDAIEAALDGARGITTGEFGAQNQVPHEEINLVHSGMPGFESAIETPGMTQATGTRDQNVIDDGPKRLTPLDISDRTMLYNAGIGSRYPKYQAEATALGQRPFVDDMHLPGMRHAALRFTEHPRARVLGIDTAEAETLKGVIRVLTAKDIPGEQYIGLIFQDWPLMVAVGDTTHCIGDVLAAVVAENEAIARKAASLIHVGYEVMEPVTDMHEAIKDRVRVHDGRSNVLENCSIRFGETDKAFEEAAYISSGIYETQRIEHAFLETETAIALPEGDGVLLYSQGQGVYVDRLQVAKLLALDEDKVRVVQVQNGGGFGGKEDLTVQGHAALCARLLQQPVRVHLNRKESINMHPKRHPVWMDIALAADRHGKLTGLKLRAFGDTGAYASVGTKVMERVVGHATGAYKVPSVDIEALTVYTNNIPSGAMRGFGVPQITFAIESCIDDICRQGGFDRWQLRYDNALQDGATTATGQRLQGVGLKKTLLAVKDVFTHARYAGIACGIKNTGVGNGMVDDSEVIIEVLPDARVVIHHGWTEMGQGVHTMAIQTLFEETGIDPRLIEMVVDTAAGIPTGMTTSSRATALLGNAIIDAAKRMKLDMLEIANTEGTKDVFAGITEPSHEKKKKLTSTIKTNLSHNNEDLTGVLNKLSGRRYKGKFVCDWTCKPGADADDPKIHFAYGYATQVVILDDEGRISKVIAAHDAGKIMNRMLFEGQIEGAIHMGLGYALTEDLPLRGGKPLSSKFKDLGVLRADKMPDIEVIGIEEPDQYGPYGAKGIGEIGMVPTAAAVVNALTAYDNKRRYIIPVNKPNK